MRRLGIESVNFGSHSLRHACATELLRKGTSLKDIASFLGHRNIESVSVYAKYDNRMLRAVAVNASVPLARYLLSDNFSFPHFAGSWAICRSVKYPYRTFRDS
jgi:hypothetical protein